MVKQPSGSFDISRAHCMACGPVIVISMVESIDFSVSGKGRPKGVCHISLHLRKNAPQVGLSAGRVAEREAKLFVFVFGK